jgi:hypothetical protein
VTTSRIQRLMGVLYEKVGERKENARRESMLEVHNMYKIPTAREEGGKGTKTIGEKDIYGTGDMSEGKLRDRNAMGNVGDYAMARGRNVQTKTRASEMMRPDVRGPKAEKRRELEMMRVKAKCPSLLYSSSSSSSSSWMAGAADRPPGNCLRDVLPSIVSPKVSMGCEDCPIPGTGPFPRTLVFPPLNH